MLHILLFQLSALGQDHQQDEEEEGDENGEAHNGGFPYDLPGGKKRHKQMLNRVHSLFICRMKAASLQEIKQELGAATPATLVALCLRLARHKKENKELLTYLLFEAADEQAYIRQVQKELAEGFTTINSRQLYLAKKTVRKVLRLANKYIRFAGSKAAEAEIRMEFCRLFRKEDLPLTKNSVLGNLYQGQLKKVQTAISTMHEDLQYDYQRQLDRLL